MPPYPWTSDPIAVVIAFENRHSNPEAGALLSWAQVDHVVPWNVGGTTDPSNLVTSCWACNYGKHNFTLDQIRVADPRLRMPSVKSEGSWYLWDGLMSLLPSLQRRAKPGRAI